MPSALGLLAVQLPLGFLQVHSFRCCDLTSLNPYVCVFSEPSGHYFSFRPQLHTVKIYPHFDLNSVMETPPAISPREPGFEIRTKYKEAIRQLHWRAKFPVELLMNEYYLGKSTIIKILNYDAPERVRLMRTGRHKLLSDARVDKIIEILSSS